ncbi:MAG: DUF2726 domain-containing protein [Clostridia bacterium]|nr:DUF2726 domain-containing protein [Clostridia bacterium]
MFISFVIIAIIVAYFENKIKHIENIQNDEIKQEVDYKEKYYRRDYILTPTELKFYKILKNITDELNLVICPQVSLYEIVRNKEHKDFNKIARKSIDFVITEQNLKIKLCIELDDYTHNRQSRIYRDNFINEVFNATEVKILRIPVQNFYNMEQLETIIKESL